MKNTLKTPNFRSDERTPTRPVATYSIVARDEGTGQMGVAVQSHWFSVGAIVPWAEAGVGAVATQSFVEAAYGPLGLTLMAAGRSASEALAALVSTDEDEAVRQVAMVDANGHAAVHTGDKAIWAAGHYLGDGFSVQANLMENEFVWGAMASAYEKTEGDLAERLLAALEAAEGEGGDIRGKQSAALLVVSPESSGKPWDDRIFDLRVEDHPEPVPELRRLVKLKRAYIKLNEGDALLAKNDHKGALGCYQEALTIVPDSATNGEVPFWVGVTLVSIKKMDQAEPYLKRAYRQDERWAKVILRLPAAGLLPDDKALIDSVITAMVASD
ncbi:MAG: DUF1028 domain-containing protein [Chloroflexota bacterium]